MLKKKKKKRAEEEQKNNAVANQIVQGPLMLTYNPAAQSFVAPAAYMPVPPVQPQMGMGMGMGMGVGMGVGMGMGYGMYNNNLVGDIIAANIIADALY